jgi:hypothetical protein
MQIGKKKAAVKQYPDPKIGGIAVSRQLLKHILTISAHIEHLIRFFPT